ncbi:MAG TPA: rod shape-determining protein MreD [Acidimicrobiia bacterium]|nr:rod shape-determining protein MreD [Acidimicrobiia bacterium]
MTVPAVARPWPGPRHEAPADRTPPAPARPTAERTARPVPGALLREGLLGARRLAPAGAAVLTVLVAHVAVTPHLAVNGVAPDVVLAAVVAVATGRGARAGAAFGFAAGLGADLFLTTPLGTVALASTLLGHAVGVLRSAPSSSATAAALCGPGSACFSCRNGRAHPPGGVVADSPGAVRSLRARQRVVSRRRALRRALLVTALGVGAGRLATTVVATALGGVPFPGPGALGRAAAVALLSAPLGPPLVALVRRAGAPTRAGGRG